MQWKSCWTLTRVGLSCELSQMRQAVAKTSIFTLSSVLETQSATLGKLTWAWLQYDDVWERRDLLGVHKQKQPGLSWVGAGVTVGRLFADDFNAFADVCDK